MLNILFALKNLLCYYEYLLIVEKVFFIMI